MYDFAGRVCLHNFSRSKNSPTVLNILMYIFLQCLYSNCCPEYHCILFCLNFLTSSCWPIRHGPTICMWLAIIKEEGFVIRACHSICDCITKATKYSNIVNNLVLPKYCIWVACKMIQLLVCVQRMYKGQYYLWTDLIHPHVVLLF